MADKESAKRIIKKSETMRERAQKAGDGLPKNRRLRVTARSASKPFRVAKSVAGKTYFLPLPNTSFWQFLNKPRRVLPGFFTNAFKELKLVTWPDRKETWKLTSAVFVFAIAFGTIIAITDYGLDKLFRKIILK